MSHRTPESAYVDIDGHKLRRIRKLELNQSLAQFGRNAGISESYVCLIERAGRRVSPAVYARICDAAGVKDRRELLRTTRQDGAA